MASKQTWWIVGGAAGCLGLVVIAAIAGGIGFLASRDQPAGDDVAGLTDPAPVSAPVEPPPGIGQTVTWTNAPGRLAGEKVSNFLPFTFDYPAAWQVVEDGSQPDEESPNFVKVERMTDDHFTIENFAVGWYAGAGAAQVLDAVEPQFAASFPNYEKVGNRTWTLDGISSPGLLFQARLEAPTGPVRFYGRVMTVPVEADRGLVLVMFASELAPGVESAEDVGEEGQMPVILESFDVLQ